MTTNMAQYAEELAARSYTEIVYRDHTTTGGYIYVAENQELKGCIAQGETIQEARENLRLVRLDFIEHLLEHNLPVPSPVPAGIHRVQIAYPDQSQSDHLRPVLTSPYEVEPA